MPDRRARFAAIVVGILAICLAPRMSVAQCVVDEVVASGAGSLEFGSSVALDATASTMIVGAPRNASASAPGQAYFFQATGNGWSQAAVFLASDPSNGDRFGRAVSISGDWAIVGAPSNDSAGVSAGAAYLFHRVGGAWGFAQKLLASDASALSEFGSAVAIDGDWAMVGAPLDSGAAFLSGAVYVFKRTGTTWNQTVKLFVVGALGNEQFGSSVSISGIRAIVGAPGDSAAQPSAGRAFVLARSVETWFLEATLAAPVPQAKDVFGSSVFLDVDTAAIGAPGAGNSGAVFVAKRTGPVWSTPAALATGALPAGAALGATVALRGTALVAAAPEADGIGEVRLYRLNGASWVDKGTLELPGAASGDMIGRGVAVGLNEIAIGVPLRATLGGADAGIVDVIESAFTPDCNANLLPDPCEPDCNGNAQADACDIAAGTSLDCDGNGVPDECEDPICVPQVVNVAIDGAIWSDPTNGGTQVPAVITLTGTALFADELRLSNLDYEIPVTQFSADPGGQSVTFAVPPFPPGRFLQGTFNVELRVVTRFGDAVTQITYGVVRKTVGVGQNFPTLAAAVAAAKPGWVLALGAGNFLLTAPVNLGAVDSITVSGAGASTNLVVSADTIDGIVFTGNSRHTRVQKLDVVGAQSGMLVSAGARPYIEHINFDDCRRGILINGGSDPFIRACTFSSSNTVVLVDGKGIGVIGGATATILDSTFVANEGCDRGTVYVDESDAPVLIANCQFVANKVDLGGGGLYVGAGGQVRSIGNLFDGNEAVSSGRGGAVHVAAQSVFGELLIEVAGNDFHGNHAKGNSDCEVGKPGGGGAIFVGQDASPKIAGNRIDGNEAQTGGAIALCKGSTALVYDNLITCNISSLGGGTGSGTTSKWFGPGIYAFDCEPRILNNTIRGNVIVDPNGPAMPNPGPAVNERAGGIHGSNMASAGTVYANNVIDSNDGWGIYHDSLSSNTFVDIVNNDVFGNAQSGLCPNCNASCAINCASPLCGCNPEDGSPGWSFGNLGIAPQYTVVAPACGVGNDDDYELGAASPLQGAGYPYYAAFDDDRYVLYHPSVPVDVGFIDRDGVLSSTRPVVTEARSIGWHAAVAGAVAAPTAVSIENAAMASVLDFNLFFIVDPAIAGQPTTFVARFAFDAAAPSDGSIELALIPEYGAHSEITLCADLNGDREFETNLGIAGEVDPEQGTVRFDGVNVAALEGMWLVGLVGAVAPPSCTPDLNADGDVGGADLGILLATWGACGACPADLNRDRQVNGADLGILLAAWGSCR